MDCTTQIQHWFYLCLALCGVILALLAMFFNYSLKLKDKQISLEKHQKEIKKEVQEVERVNGKEKRDIKELQNKVERLQEQLKTHDQ